MSFDKKRNEFFNRIEKIVKKHGRIDCVRLDKIYEHVGTPLHIQQEIHDKIDYASLLIMDLTGMRMDVIYEVGYSFGRKKDLLIIAPKNSEMPSVLKGLRIIEYEDDEEGIKGFELLLRRYLKDNYAKRYMKKAMIIPKFPNPSIILSNPRPPRKQIRKDFMKPYGDYIGVVGLIRAFGSEFGDDVHVSLDSSEWNAEDVYNWDANIYLIGSPRSNKSTEFFLDKVQDGTNKKWRFVEYGYNYDKDMQEKKYTQ